MGFIKGSGKFQKGEGGRRKGSKNKATQEFRKVLEEKGFCLASAFLHIYENALQDYQFSKAQLMSERFSPMEDNCYKYMQNLISVTEKIASYSHPKLKSIEQTKNPAEQDRPLKNLSDEELDKL